MRGQLFSTGVVLLRSGALFIMIVVAHSPATAVPANLRTNAFSAWA
jgi:hypothetical protein